MAATNEYAAVDASDRPARTAPPRHSDRLRLGFSRVALLAALALLAATFFLLSPPRDETYPGAIPWGEFSILRPLTEVLSLNGLVATARGTEIKDLALHLAAVLGLALLAARLIAVGSGAGLKSRIMEPWFAAQILLVGWVGISALSVLWAGDAALARGQAALYALALAWAVSLAWTLESRDVPRVLGGVVVVAALAGALCIWYFFERNPYHRPGFPLGNPGTLGASLLPALLLAGCTLVGAGWQWFWKRRRPRWWLVIGAAVALVPLAWCFGLTYSRAALLGLAVGAAAILFVQSGRLVRWSLAGLIVVGTLAAGLSLMGSSRLDTAMARGATIRFRLYAWRYAAELWEQSWFTAVAGQGAGSYPRLAGQLSVHDRALDPAAFMGDIVEHAHNELFEVLTEIGLVGGVTFVGGVLATLAAGRALLRSRLFEENRWLLAGLFGAVVALLVDSLFSPGLRLAGVPAVFWTLVGTLWAAGRAARRAETGDVIAELAGWGGQPAGSLSQARVVAGVAAAVFAVGTGWLTADNWRGVVREEAGQWEMDQGQFSEAANDFEYAESLLLDPVRQLVTAGRAAQARLNAARVACEYYAMRRASGPPAADSQPASGATGALADLRSAALERARAAYQTAARLGRRAPTLMRSGLLAASAGELLGELYRETDDRRSQRWYRLAAEAWHIQRLWRPHDVETLLALTHYADPLYDHVRLLRDALRSTSGRDRWGRPMGLGDVRTAWQQALRRKLDDPRFGPRLAEFVAGVGPADPDTELDSLMASWAPEVYRLAAHWQALHGDYAAAERYAARAALLYRPMRSRLPVLESVALLERAEFVLTDSPARAMDAAELVRAGLEALPAIQRQKYDELAWPFRCRLAEALLAADEIAGAADVMRAAVGEGALARALADRYVGLARLYIRRPTPPRPDVTRWLDAALELVPDHVHAWSWRAWLAAERGDTDAVEAVLAAAGGAGVAESDRRRIRDGLCQEFPALCAQLSDSQ